MILSLFPALALAQDKENSDSFATVNGENIWYKIIGKGEPVVLIPGGPGSSHCVFLPWFDDLAGHFRVIYFDALGRGKSSRAKNKAEFVMLEKSGHFPFVEERDKFMEVVSRFLSGTK